MSPRIQKSFREPPMTENNRLKAWVDEMSRLCKPDRVVWLDGSEEEKKRLQDLAVSTGEIIPLNPEKHPDSFYHRTNDNDVARTEHLTFICTRRKEDAGPNNNWMAPADAYRKASAHFEGSMKGRTMYVIPFSMGPVSSPFA